MKSETAKTAMAVLAIAATGPALAQSPDYMMEDCMVASQGFYQEFDSRSETTYEGQRTDGTHAVNGTIYLENRASDFQCSYNSAGDMMVDFFADGQSWPDFAQLGESPYMDGASAPSSEPPASDGAAMVEFDPGEYGTMLEGAIVGRETFDYGLGASAGQELYLDLQVDGTNGDGTIYFNVLAPGSTGEAIYNSSMEGNTGVTIELPESGVYVVRLYLMGNDADTDKTVGYNLDVSIQ